MIQKKTEENQSAGGGKINISEMGRTPDGRTISSDRRLFMQLQAWGGAKKTAALIADLEAGNIHGVLYEDINDPTGVALLTFSEDPDYFVQDVREFLKGSHFGGLTPKPEYTMLGRSYTLGYEENLDEVLIDRPRSRVCNPEYPWAIWYPLRRSGSFEELPAKEQRAVLMEHGGIGRAFGAAGYVFDVRLSCHGLDKNDNDFVIGLIGPDLYPLSAIVERMRKTQQTRLHLQRLGPFFIGKVAWQTKKAV